VKVRTARHEDTATVADLLDEATRWVHELGFEQWPLPFPRRELGNAIDRGEVYVVEEEGGEPVATVTLLWDDPMYWGERPPDAVYVHKLAVRRDRAGRGIGAAIVAWVNAEAAEAGREFLRLDCLSNNPGIRDYYERLGFEHQRDLVLDGRDMSLYERSVRP
jgi:predicted N-acetyltransferase YhbS